MFYRTGDPERDYLRYDRERERELSRLPKCSYCGERITGDYVFVFDDKRLCEECLNEEHRHDVEDYID
jgi:formylmethanofuran dehydrogenase subunit E